MGDIIYWKKYDEPKPYSHTHTWKDKDGNEKSFTDTGEVTGEWVCTDERVEKAWQYGGLSLKGDRTAVLYSALFMKNGERKEFKNDHDFSQAEQYLKELKSNP